MKRAVTLMALLCLLFVSLCAAQAAEYTAPTPITGLIYDGEPQDLLNPGETDDPDMTFYYRMSTREPWSTEVPQRVYPGLYDVLWIYSSSDSFPALNSPDGHWISNIFINEEEGPVAREGLVYKKGDKQYLIDPEQTGVTYNSDQYYFRDFYNGHWSTQLPVGEAAKTYYVEYLLWGPETPGDNVGKFGTLAVTIRGGSNHSGNSDSGSSGSGGNTFYQFGNGDILFALDLNLPATGFPTRFSKPLSIQPDTVHYEDLALRIQIPTIDVDVELTGVPADNGVWQVEWLGYRAGLLSGSAKPGEGYSMIAAHNHLNESEAGPFALLYSLSENDRIFLNTEEDGLQIYKVYANELFEANDMQKLAAIAQSEDNCLILVTCENELVDGGYQNRRAVFAKPVN